MLSKSHLPPLDADYVGAFLYFFSSPFLSSQHFTEKPEDFPDIEQILADNSRKDKCSAQERERLASAGWRGAREVRQPRRGGRGGRGGGGYTGSTKPIAPLEKTDKAYVIKTDVEGEEKIIRTLNGYCYLSCCCCCFPVDFSYFCLLFKAFRALVLSFFARFSHPLCSILNKLTPEKFEVLIKQVVALEIKTVSLLKQVRFAPSMFFLFCWHIDATSVFYRLSMPSLRKPCLSLRSARCMPSSA